MPTINKILLELNELFRKYYHWLKPEALEQAQLVLWLEKNGYTYTAIPNSTFTNSMKQKILNKMLGLKPGLCDMLIILKRGSLLFIELKRQRKIKQNGELGASPSVVSDEQKEWVAKLSALDNVMACIAYGWEDAVAWVEHFEDI